MKMKIILILIIALFFIHDSGFCMLSSSPGEDDDEGLTVMKVSALRGGFGKYNAIDIDREIGGIGRFAVQEYNKKENSQLEFARVIKAEQQVVSGKMYHLTLEVIDGGNKKIYEAKVWVKPWMNFKQLQEFKLVSSSTPNQSAAIDEDSTSYSSGWQTVPTNDPTVQDAARYAVTTIQRRSNCLGSCFLSEILLARTKGFENGIKFYLVMKTKWGKREKIYKVMLFKNIHGKFYGFEFL